MKYFKFILLIAFVILPKSVFAEDVTDQVCYGDPLGQGRPVSIKFTLHGQVFRPTVTHIKKIAIFARAASGNSAKVKLKLQKAWWSANTATYEKTVVVNENPWWVEADFSEAVVIPGADYFLTAEPLNNAMIEWYISDDANCNPNGYAFVGGDIEREKDFYFLTRGNSETIQLQEPIDEIASETPPISSSTSDSGTSSNATSENSTASQPSSSSQATSSSTASKESTSDGSGSSKSYATNKELSTANKIVQNNENLSDEELEDLLKMIAEDYANRKKGMFGLGGAVGSRLTPAVFYSTLGLVLLVFVIIIIRFFKKKQNELRG